jgi:hypothetical protein
MKYDTPTISLVNVYAKAIYIDWTKRFSEIRSEYVEPEKQHAAVVYSEITV